MAEQRIVGFRQDQEQHWVAQLECGHAQHVRHTPPWEVRPWVLTSEGRIGRLGTLLPCRQCNDRESAEDLERLRIAEQVRSALVQAALAAYADAGVRGLCHEGAWELALSAMRQLHVGAVLAGEPSPVESAPEP